MAAPLKSAKGKSSTVSSPRDGFFAPFRARWRDRRAADLSLPTRPGNSARTWIPGGDPEAPPGPTLGNRGKSSFPLDFPQKTSKIPGISQTFQEYFHKFLIFSQDSRKSQGFPRIPKNSQGFPRNVFVFPWVFLFLNGFPWSSPGIPQEIPEVPKNSQRD